MLKSSILSSATCLALFGLMLVPSVPVRGQDRPKPAAKRPAPAAAPQADKATAPKAGTLPEEQPAAATPPVSKEQAADEEAIRQANESFAKAYAAGDAKSAAAHFTPDAEYVDELGNVFQGRAAIEETLTAFLAENPACKLEFNVDTIRFISPGVAVEDGSTAITLPDTQVSAESRYTAVHVKTDGKWLSASVRDHAPKDRRQHRAQLEQLDWLLGDWVDEGDDSIVVFNCEYADNGNFLVRNFTILVAGQEAMAGTQRIGWDPLTGKLRTWIFDTEGGYGEGLWHRNGDDWVLRLTGVTADGEPASSTSVYTFVNEHTMTWQSLDHEIAGVQLPDSEVVTIVRQAPAPAPVVANDKK